MPSHDSHRQKDPLLDSFQLRSLQLRNRIMSTAHAPAYVENGWPTERYRLYHEEKAKGGLALTVVGGSTNVSSDSPSAFGQLYAGDDSILPWFELLTGGVHSHGAAIMCQLTHMGRRTSSDVGEWLPVIGPSNTRERAHRAYPKSMERADIVRVTKDFAAAAVRCKKGGFDGIEILSHSHLLGQFLSPLINFRQDDYGGSLENRLRLTFDVLNGVRDAVGDEFIIGLRITGNDFLKGGLSREDCIEIAQRLEQCGLVDFLNVLAGAPYDDLGLAQWMPPMGTPAARFLGVAKDIREAVLLPIFYAGGIADIATARHALRDGIVDMVGMTRAHIADPYLVSKLQTGQEDRIRTCVGMNYCADRVNQGKDALCGQNAATGRERFFPHRFRRHEIAGLRAVVVGGGPGGLEASRVLAERGYRVTLFEASNQLGGQINMAAGGSTRRQMRGVIDWLVNELEHLGVDVRYNMLAEAEDILREKPVLVVIATGALPRSLNIGGAHLARPIWDVFTGQPPVGEVIIFDDRGDHHSLVAAEVATQSGACVTLLTPDRTPLHNLGPTNYGVGMRNLYQRGVNFLTDREIVALRPDGNRLTVTVRNVLTDLEEKFQADHVFYEVGTEENAELYFELQSHSVNNGQIEVASLLDGKAEYRTVNPAGDFVLFRIGDAVSSRNIHAALFDALRVCSVITVAGQTGSDQARYSVTHRQMKGETT
ncbi:MULTISPECIES: FAD-dependent oxidoreductase [Mesorhizobium]|uniref:oxidoreductase n=1 Tax=Mesorhizobium TaxID=68287 RepID=UPI00210069B9|nr:MULTISPECIES: FAD-dependent oxidoreductase [Mesorhizobium]MDF3215029.1 FAD-dependent oxidoreductase [Mesorhizobium ciceri]